jgi:hypothetical protein
MELLEHQGGIESADRVRSVRLRMPAGPEFASLGRLALTGVAQARGVDGAALEELKLALTDAVCDVEPGVHAVDIRFVLLADRVVVEIEPQLP